MRSSLRSCFPFARSGWGRRWTVLLVQRRLKGGPGKHQYRLFVAEETHHEYTGCTVDGEDVANDMIHSTGKCPAKLLATLRIKSGLIEYFRPTFLTFIAESDLATWPSIALKPAISACREATSVDSAYFLRQSQTYLDQPWTQRPCPSIPHLALHVSISSLSLPA